MLTKLNEILEKMEEINYGFIYDGKIIQEEDFKDTFSLYYHLSSPEEIKKTKVGVCWDQVELERYYLESKNILSKSYFIIKQDKDMTPTHTFIVVQDESYFYWLEHSWYKERGIREYSSLKELLQDVKLRFASNQKNDSNIEIYEYKKPIYNISCDEFMKHCLKGEKQEI